MKKDMTTSNQQRSLLTEHLSTLFTEGAKIIDVRTIHEFAGGHLEGSYNIPLEDIPLFIGELQRWQKILILVSADGYRSQKATQKLHFWRIEAYDAGAWKQYQSIPLEKKP